MSFDQYQPYGPVTETTMRIVTWNVWGRYGRWRERQAGIEETLAATAPDVACLVESWSHTDAAQPVLVAKRLGLAHSVFSGGWEHEDWVSGIGLVSRWPVVSHERRALQAEHGSVLFAIVDGDRGPIQIFAVMLDYPLDASAVRQAQVRQLAGFIQEVARRRHPIVVCGDFNAGPDADELRMLTGRGATAAPGLVFYDAWEIAGDGTPGYTWSNRNPLAATALYPDRRLDYVLSAWPGGAAWATRPGASFWESAPPASRNSPTTTGSWRTCVTDYSRPGGRHAAQPFGLCRPGGRPPPGRTVIDDRMRVPSARR